MKTMYSSVASGGMDVHHTFSNVTFRDANERIVRRERLDHRDRDRLRERLSQWPKGVPIVLEASFGWGWLSDEMAGQGLQPALSNGLKVDQMRQARGWPKTNRKDADLLSLLPFEGQSWWQVWLAPPTVRDRRERLRYRADLVGVQTQIKNRIHAIFHRHGIFHDVSDLFGVKGRAFLVALCQDGSEHLSPSALSVLQGQVTLLNEVRRHLAHVARQLKRDLNRTPEVRRLQTIPGLGLILAHVLVAEIGEIGRFRGDKPLARYSVLAPQAADTGQADPHAKPQGRHLGHRGNLTLKWAFIEAAHGAVRSGGKWRAMFDRYTDGGKTNCNRGYIKVARQ